MVERLDAQGDAVHPRRPHGDQFAASVQADIGAQGAEQEDEGQQLDDHRRRLQRHQAQDAQGLAGKRFDFVVTSVVVTKERNDKFAFTVPIADATVALVKRAGDSSISKLEDISGKVVGSQAGSGQLKALMGYDQQLKAAGKPGRKAKGDAKGMTEDADLVAEEIEEELAGEPVAESTEKVKPLRMKTLPAGVTLSPLECLSKS